MNLNSGKKGPRPDSRAGRKRWWTLFVVALMLLSMVAYIMTMDESLPPAADLPAPAVPAAP